METATENPMLQEEEVKRLFRKLEHYGISQTHETRDGGHLAVTATGVQIPVVSQNVKGWCPNVIVQPTGAPNSLILIWEAGTFVTTAERAPTKLEGTKPDAEVLDQMTRQQIDTLDYLHSVLKKLDADIEAAYPDTRLANSGLGQGKRDLVIKVMDALHERSSQNVPQFMTYVAIRLARHLAQQNYEDTIEIPEPARASARVR